MTVTQFIMFNPFFSNILGAGKDYDEDDLYEAMLDSDEFDEDSSDDEWIIEDEG